MQDIIGARGWCRKCKHSKVKRKSVYCQNSKSPFYNLKVNSILCSPCFETDETKKDIEIQYVGFSS